jgi:hypothetical protein
MLAARRLAPLKPTDLAVAHAHLANDAEQPHRAAADKTAAELPEKILGAALADPALPARVLDFFATRVATRPALAEVVLLNRATPDETIVDLVPRLKERELEIVATNEERFLRHPAIIAALYMSADARMSTVDRVVELAVRNNVQVPGIGNWSDVVSAVLGTQNQPPAPSSDAAFAAVARLAVGDTPAAPAVDEDSDFEVLNAEEQKKVEEEKRHVPYDQLTVMAKLRLATMGNAFARAMCIRDSVKIVALAAVNSPGMTDNEVIKYSANRTLVSEVIMVIANTREWTKLYAVKVNLVNNAKCPLPTSMKFLPFLRDRELRNVARSRSVPSALVAQAKKLVQQKMK